MSLNTPDETNKKELENIASEIDDVVIQLSQTILDTSEHERDLNNQETAINAEQTNTSKDAFSLDQEKLSKYVVTQQDVDEVNKEMEDLFGAPMQTGGGGGQFTPNTYN